jgi:hypothetical protein
LIHHRRILPWQQEFALHAHAKILGAHAKTLASGRNDCKAIPARHHARPARQEGLEDESTRDAPIPIVNPF